MPAPGVDLRITARDLTRAALDSAGRGLRGLEGQVARMRTAVAGLAGALSVGALVAFAKAGIDTADNLKAMSDRLGISVEDLSALRFVAEQSDTDFQTLTEGLQKFQLALAKAGVSTTDTVGVLGALADHVQKTSDAGQRFAIVAKAFGRAAGPELVNLLAQGSNGINAQIERLREMGGVMSEENAAASAAFNDQLAAIQTQVSALAVEIGGGFLAGLREFNLTMTSPELIGSMREFGTMLGRIAGFAVEFADKIAVAGAAVAGFVAAGPIGGVLAGLGTAAFVGPEGQFEKVGIALGKTSESVDLLKGRIEELSKKAAAGRAELAKLGAGDPGGQRLGIEKGIHNAEVAIGRLQTRLNELGKGGTVPKPELERFLASLRGGEDKARKKAEGAAKQALSDAKALIEASLAATQDALEREQRTLDQALEDELVSFRDFYERRTAIAVAGIDAEIAAKREALRVTKDQGDVERLTQEITILERKRGDVAVEARRDQIAAERELVDQLADVRARVLEAEGRTAEATRLRLQQEFAELTARLQIEGDQAGAALVKRLFNIEAARGELQELQAEFDRVREQLARSETRVNVEVETGLQTQLAGRREIVRLHTETAAKLDPIIDKMRVIAQTIGPEEVSRVAGLALEVDNLDLVTNEVAQSLNNEFKNAAGSAFGDFLRGAKSAQQAFADFGTAVLDAIAQIAAQNIAEAVFGDLFKSGRRGGSPGGGVSDLLDIFGSLFGAVLHQGGTVGLRGPGRRVPALAFAGAPRLQEGGILGLQKNEVPAILHRGEEVLARDDPRHRFNQGGNVTVNMVVNSPDVQGFRRSQGEIAVQVSTAIGRAARNRP